MLLVSLLPDFNLHYRVVLVSLKNKVRFPEEKLVCSKLYTLGFEKSSDCLNSSLKLRRIIRHEKPALVKSDLYWSTIVARLATPRGVPLLSVVHNTLSNDAFLKNRKSLHLERLTNGLSNVMLYVSDTVINDYEEYVRSGVRKYILKNFVGDNFLNEHYVFPSKEKSGLKLVTVSNLKPTKNHKFLLTVMQKLKGLDFSLDIYGEGELRCELQEIIDRERLPVQLKGSTDQIASLLPNYDVFIMCSLYEGYPVALMEAMAVGLPCILNDIPVMKEVTGNNAYYYENGNADACANAIITAEKNKSKFWTLSLTLKNQARMHFSKDSYFKQLKNVIELSIARYS